MAGYLPAAAAERAAQYAALGLSGPEALYRDVPESVRLTAPLNLPPPQSELEARGPCAIHRMKWDNVARTVRLGRT